LYIIVSNKKQILAWVNFLYKWRISYTGFFQLFFNQRFVAF